MTPPLNRPAGPSAGTPATTGVWVFVCGPSGSGKDSVIAYARQALTDRGDIVFTRRFVTRAAHAGSDHDPLTEAAFQERLQAGGLCWHWQAHGFSYGIGQQHEAAVRAGCLVVINGSREHVSTLPPSPEMRVVEIRADDAALAMRLKQRGRDSAEAVALRLSRNARFDTLRADCVIVNDGELAQAGQQLAHYLANAGVRQLTPARTPA